MNGWRRLTLHERWIKRQQEQPDPAEDDRHELELFLAQFLGLALGMGLLVGLLFLVKP